MEKAQQKRHEEPAGPSGEKHTAISGTGMENDNRESSFSGMPGQGTVPRIVDDLPISYRLSLPPMNTREIFSAPPSPFPQSLVGKYQQIIDVGVMNPGSVAYQLMDEQHFRDGMHAADTLVAYGLRPFLFEQSLQPEDIASRAGLQTIIDVAGTYGDIQAVIDEQGRAAVQVPVPGGFILLNDFLPPGCCLYHNDGSLFDSGTFQARIYENPGDAKHGDLPGWGMEGNWKLLTKTMTQEAAKAIAAHELGHLGVGNQERIDAKVEAIGNHDYGYTGDRIGQLFQHQAGLLEAENVLERPANLHASAWLAAFGLLPSTVEEFQRKCLRTYDLKVLHDISSLGFLAGEDYERRPISDAAKQAFRQRLWSSPINVGMLSEQGQRYTMSLGAIKDAISTYYTSGQAEQFFNGLYPIREGVTPPAYPAKERETLFTPGRIFDERPAFGTGLRGFSSPQYEEGEIYRQQAQRAVQEYSLALAQNPANADAGLAFAASCRDVGKWFDTHAQSHIAKEWYNRAASSLDSFSNESLMEGIFVKPWEPDYSINDSLLDAAAVLLRGLRTEYPDRLSKAFSLTEGFATAAQFLSDIDRLYDQLTTDMVQAYLAEDAIGQLTFVNALRTHMGNAAAAQEGRDGEIASAILSCTAKQFGALSRVHTSLQADLKELAKDALQRSLDLNPQNDAAHREVLALCRSESVRENGNRAVVQNMEHYYAQLLARSAGSTDEIIVRYSYADFLHQIGKLQTDIPMMEKAYREMQPLFSMDGVPADGCHTLMSKMLRETNAADVSHGGHSQETLLERLATARGHLDQIHVHSPLSLELRTVIATDTATILSRLAQDDPSKWPEALDAADEALGVLEETEQFFSQHPQYRTHLTNNETELKKRMEAILTKRKK